MEPWIATFRSRRLALRLVALIILASTTLAALVTGLELLYEYKKDIDAIDRRMIQVEVAHVDSITENLWVMDRDRLSTQLSGIARLPDFVLAEIWVDGQILLRYGDSLSGPGVTREFPMVRTYRGAQQTLGTLVVAATYSEAYERLLRVLLWRLAANLVKTLIVAGFALWLFYRLIGRHLDHIVAYAEDPTPEGQKPLLFLDRAEPELDDELARLVVAINGPRAQLLDLVDRERERAQDFEKQTLLLRQELVARKKIQQQLNVMARVFERSEDAIVLTDAQGRIEAVNDAFVAATGYPRDEVLGKNPSMLASGQTPLPVYEAMWDALRRSGTWQGQVINRHKSGYLLPVTLSVSAVRDSADRVLNYLGVYTADSNVTS